MKAEILFVRHTQSWNPEFLAKYGIKDMYSRYLIDPDGQFRLFSSMVYESEFLNDYYILTPLEGRPPLAERDPEFIEELEDAIGLAGAHTEPTEYFNYYDVQAAKVVPCDFWLKEHLGMPAMFRVPLTHLEGDDFEDLEEARDFARSNGFC